MAQGHSDLPVTSPLRGVVTFYDVTDDWACEQGRDHDRDPLPFRLERTGRTISIGFFSRRRAINPRAAFRFLVNN